MQENEETGIQSLGWEDPLEEGRATHFSILVWRLQREAWQGTVHRVAKSRTQPHFHQSPSTQDKDSTIQRSGCDF